MYDQSQAMKAQKGAIAPLQQANATAYSKAESIANTPYTPYTGTQVAPISGSQQQGITQAKTAATDGRASGDIAQSENLAGQIAGNSWNSATAQKYMNPYTKNVTDVAQKQLNQQYANTIAGQDARATSQNAFGGDRAALTNANTTGQYLNESGNLAATNQAKAYDSAFHTWQADNARANTAASAYRASGNDITQMNSAQIKDLLATGGIEQATQQMDLNSKYNNYLDQRGWAANQLQPLLQATGNKGTPAAVPTANKASDLVGIASSLAGYFGSSGGKPSSTNSGGGNPDGIGGGYGTGAGSALNDSSYFSGAASSAPSISGCDRRIKDRIEPLGKDSTGLMRYRFSYLGDSQRLIGYMADEVKQRFPHAVTSLHGFLRVHYARIPGGLSGVLHG
jgi:hypothetical protein